MPNALSGMKIRVHGERLTIRSLIYRHVSHWRRGKVLGGARERVILAFGAFESRSIRR